MRKVQDSENRILLAIVGNSPAVVTETLYALTQTEDNPYIPTEIQIITNAGNYLHVIETLLGEDGKVYECCKDYNIPLPIFSKSNIYQIISKDGVTLEDVTTKEDNEIIADFITNKVRELTTNDDTSLHVSIAGGRKTMTYYLGYAMSVFGRIQDTMSHVIINDKYMSEDFYYPTPQKKMMVSFKKEIFDASKVEVMLGYLPYLRLRDRLVEKFFAEEKITFSQLIEASQAQLDPPLVKVSGNQLFLGSKETQVKLSNKELTLYLLVLIHHQNSIDRVEISKRGENNRELINKFLSIYGDISGDSKHTSKYHKEEDTKTVLDPLEQDNITSTQSRINRKIKNTLGEPLAYPYLIKSSGKKFDDILIYSFSNELEPDNIVICHNLKLCE